VNRGGRLGHHDRRTGAGRGLRQRGLRRATGADAASRLRGAAGRPSRGRRHGGSPAVDDRLRRHARERLTGRRVGQIGLGDGGNGRRRRWSGVVGGSCRFLRGRRRRRGSSLRLGRRAAGRQERLRVHVTVRLRRDAHAEVDVRLGRGRIAARADAGDEDSLFDGVALRNQQLSELQERNGVAVGRLDGERLPATGNDAGEGHGSGRRRPDVRAELAADVDPAVLVARIRVGAEHERPQNRPGGRPCPRVRGRHDQ
jgi:hypothetical protein